MDIRKRLKRIGMTAVMVTLLTGCSNRYLEQPVGVIQGDAVIELEQTQMTVTRWKMDNSHVESLVGKVLVNGKPVTDVVVNVAGKRKITTDENGVFRFYVDRSVPQVIQLRVEEVDGATFEGKSLKRKLKNSLRKAENNIQVSYPIQVTAVKSDPEDDTKVEVHARAMTEDGQSYPVIKADKYLIKGVVKDHTGAPVQGAIVAYSKNGNEGFSRSQPTNEQGEYILYYLPEANEDILLSVTVGDIKYTLPKNRVNHFPVETSVYTNFILPATGTIIEDKPPNLVSGPAEGALYWCRLIGLNVDKSVKYSVTVPSPDGSFIVKIDKAEWEKAPRFYQTVLSKLSMTVMKAGDFIPSEWLPAPKTTDPSDIVAEVL
ncbi:MAG: hypothetical protein P0Y55_03300 [Candidatus Cohnella colombiensis]|uniref:Carboxypeptidase regulatory-like domain-containing protein n=1 Tax=Candidatus Cohnella colombiensis TaxID=3121368 RepID=A0AA95JGL7_9BACL|nr:MAG: hypothetical protein P0Y55_03300 [Cohnella sp.]